MLCSDIREVLDYLDVVYGGGGKLDSDMDKINKELEEIIRGVGGVYDG